MPLRKGSAQNVRVTTGSCYAIVVNHEDLVVVDQQDLEALPTRAAAAIHHRPRLSHRRLTPPSLGSAEHKDHARSADDSACGAAERLSRPVEDQRSKLRAMRRVSVRAAFVVSLTVMVWLGGVQSVVEKLEVPASAIVKV